MEKYPLAHTKTPQYCNTGNSLNHRGTADTNRENLKVSTAARYYKRLDSHCQTRREAAIVVADEVIERIQVKEISAGSSVHVRVDWLT
jgi:predicted transcriptional regulator of viral defense system